MPGKTPRSRASLACQRAGFNEAPAKCRGKLGGDSGVLGVARRLQ